MLHVLIWPPPDLPYYIQYHLKGAFLGRMRLHSSRLEDEIKCQKRRQFSFSLVRLSRAKKQASHHFLVSWLSQTLIGRTLHYYLL